MGDIADMMLEQEMMDHLCFGDGDRYEDEPSLCHEFPYGFHRPGRVHITQKQMADYARQAAHDGNIVERGMRAMTLDQVLARKNNNDNT